MSVGERVAVVVVVGREKSISWIVDRSGGGSKTTGRHRDARKPRDHTNPLLNLRLWPCSLRQIIFVVPDMRFRD
jgi:hypothetical protein